MKKHSFFDRQSAAITLLYNPANVLEAINLARAAEADGADGIALELNQMPLEMRTLENFRTIIDSVQLPFMFIDYRNDIFLGRDDAARQEHLLLAAEAGAEVIDVMGDLYSPDPMELTFESQAVEKQIALIQAIHERGAKVLMSSHMSNLERSAEEVLEHLLEQSRRGADILKIVVGVNTEAALTEAIRTMLLLHNKLEKPFIFLANGKFSRFIRYVGPKLGVAIEFAVHDYTPDRSYSQPTIRSMKKVMENFQWSIDNI